MELKGRTNERKGKNSYAFHHVISKEYSRPMNYHNDQKHRYLPPYLYHMADNNYMIQHYETKAWK